MENLGETALQTNDLGSERALDLGDGLNDFEEEDEDFEEEGVPENYRFPEMGGEIENPNEPEQRDVYENYRFPEGGAQRTPENIDFDSVIDKMPERTLEGLALSLEPVNPKQLNKEAYKIQNDFRELHEIYEVYSHAKRDKSSKVVSLKIGEYVEKITPEIRKEAEKGLDKKDLYHTLEKETQKTWVEGIEATNRGRFRLLYAQSQSSFAEDHNERWAERSEEFKKEMGGKDKVIEYSKKNLKGICKEDPERGKNIIYSLVQNGQLKVA